MKIFSQNATKNSILLGSLITGFSLVSFQNCSKVAVGDLAQKSSPLSTTTAEATLSTSSQPTNPSASSTAVVCDPLSVSQSGTLTSGLKGRLFYKPDNYTGTASFNFVSDYLREGIETNKDLYFSQVNVPTKRFSDGFATQDNTLIKKDNGEVLVEYFALHMESTLKLKSDEIEGQYQMAIFSDDGSMLKITEAGGATALTINNDQLHSARLSCSKQLLQMNPKTRLPITIDYFQGPREHIALIVLWRKIPAGELATAEPLCGQGGNDSGFFFDSGTSPSTPQQPYKDLLARGWKPLEPANYELANSAQNPCH